MYALSAIFDSRSADSSFILSRCSRHLRFKGALAGALILSLLTATASSKSNAPRRLLILYEVTAVHPGVIQIDQGIRAGLEESDQVEIYREYLDAISFPKKSDQDRFRDFLLRKYRDRRPEVMLTVGPSALRLIAEVHDEHFAGIPVISYLSGAQGSPPLSPAFSSITGEVDASATLEAAFHLNPSTKQVVVVAGTSTFDKQQLALVKQQIRHYEDRFKISYLTDLDMPVLLERLKHLPRDSIVLFIGVSQDASGKRFFSATESAPMIISASNAPVFTLFDILLSRGAVGGKVSNLFEDGKTMGTMALEALGGRQLQGSRLASSMYKFDSTAMKRWGFNEENLPPGSITFNQHQSVWASYSSYIVAGVSLIFIQSLLILALVRLRAKRSKVEAALRESEQRFRLVCNTAPVLIWMSDVEKQRTFFNQTWLDFTSSPLESQLGNGWTKWVHLDDLKNTLETYDRAFDQRQAYQVQYRLRRNDGQYRSISEIGVPRFEADRVFAGYIGCCVDVTDSKAAQDALSTIGRQLIEAQERERTWIARELHDDINQQIALLSIYVDQLREKLVADPSIRDELSRFSKSLQQLGDNVQSLSHRLHSSKLDLLGLTVAARSFCEELSRSQHVQIEFDENGLYGLTRETSLCLFRVLQEALQNAVKHSGVKTFKVQFRQEEDIVQLSISDHGRGFDSDQLAAHYGLGLVSMRERTQMVKGSFSVESKPGHGTMIVARVPVNPEFATESIDSLAS